MSIATDEAERYFPTQYWPHMEPNGDYLGKECYIEGVKSSDIQEAYEMGRTAEPTTLEVEESAYALWKTEVNMADLNPTEAEYTDAWEKLSIQQRDMYRSKARTVLEAARKAVSE